MLNAKTLAYFFLGRHIPQAAASMKEGKWDRKKVTMLNCFFETQSSKLCVKHFQILQDDQHFSFGLASCTCERNYITHHSVLRENRYQ